MRRALKGDKAQGALNREGQVMKMTKWSNGKAAEKSGACYVFAPTIVATSLLVAETLVVGILLWLVTFSVSLISVSFAS